MSPWVVSSEEAELLSCGVHTERCPAGARSLSKIPVLVIAKTWHSQVDFFYRVFYYTKLEADINNINHSKKISNKEPSHICHSALTMINLWLILFHPCACCPHLLPILLWSKFQPSYNFTIYLWKVGTLFKLCTYTILILHLTQRKQFLNIKCSVGVHISGIFLTVLHIFVKRKLVSFNQDMQIMFKHCT